jgi:hypothetical protein
MRLQIQVKTSTTLRRMCTIPRRISGDHLFREAIPPSESCRTCQKIDPAGLRGSQMKRMTLTILPMLRRRAHRESGMYHHRKHLQCSDFSGRNRRSKVWLDQRPCIRVSTHNLKPQADSACSTVPSLQDSLGEATAIVFVILDISNWIEAAMYTTYRRPFSTWQGF